MTSIDHLPVDAPTRPSGVVVTSLAALLVASAVPYTSYLPQLVGYLLVIAAYGLFLLGALVFDRVRTVVLTRWALLTIGTVWAVYIMHLLSDVFTGTVTTGILMRVPAFVLLTGVNLFYVPRVVDRAAFFGVLARFGAALVLVGVPTLLLGSVSLGVVEVVSYRTATFGPFQWNVLSSVFANPNTMSYIAMVGSVAAIGEYAKARSRLSLLLVAINGAGLFLAHARAAMLGAAVALAVLAFHSRLSRRGFRQAVIVSAALGVYGFVVMLGLFPDPGIFRDINLQGRQVIWRGGFEAVLSNPVFGFGPGNTGDLIAAFIEERYSGYDPHNSYLRVLIDGGLASGVAYLLFVGKTLLDQLHAPLDRLDAVTFALCAAISVSMLFQGYTLFGISITSLTAAIIFGYGIETARSHAATCTGG